MVQLIFLFVCLGVSMAELAPQTPSLLALLHNSTGHNTSLITAKISDEELDAKILSNFVRDCQAKFVSYAYEKGVCGAKNIQEFLESSKAEYTCAGRCGQKATYGKHTECSCDTACLTFEDCCKDFTETCSELYRESETLSSHLLGASAECTEDNFNVIFYGDHSGFPTSTFLPTSAKSTTAISLFTNIRSFTTSHRMLRDIAVGFPEFYVLDKTFGIIFNNYFSFNSFNELRVPGSKKPTFIPIVLVFECSLVLTRHSSITVLISQCQKSKVYHARTSFSRNCLRYNLVSCYCKDTDGGNQRFFDLRRDTCTGGRNGVPLFTRHRALVESLKTDGYDVYLNRSPSGGECYSNPNSSDKERRDWSAGNIFTVITTPIIKPTWTHVGDTKQSNGSSSSSEVNSGDYGEEEEQEEANNQELNLGVVDFVAEMTKTIERRMRCTKLHTLLVKCKLEQCAPGALLWPDPPPDVTGRFQNGVCFLPVMAVVKTGSGHVSHIPTCTCMRVMIALVDLDLWDVIGRSVQSYCVLMLNTRPETTVDIEELVFDETPRDYNFTSTVKETKDALQQRLFMSQFDCSDDRVLWLQVCFFDHETENLSNCQVSMELFAGFSGHVKDDANSQRISYLSEIFVLSGFIYNAVHVVLFS